MGAFLGLFGGQNFYKAVRKIVKLKGIVDMAVQRSRIKLG
jgi:hypothetical protein